MLEVKKIEPEAAYALRHKILRPHQAFEACIYDTDHEDATFHVGAFSNGKMICVASFNIENNPAFLNHTQYRLRAMATVEEFRRQGAGSAVVRYAEKEIKEKGYDFLWCKGRTNVQKYYEKLGFKKHGEVFDYPPIGPHIMMYKILNH